MHQSALVTISEMSCEFKSQMKFENRMLFESGMMFGCGMSKDHMFGGKQREVNWSSENDNMCVGRDGD